eukprot:scaffold150742_cov14-Tisochrysis_lutea.AAC.1
MEWQAFSAECQENKRCAWLCKYGAANNSAQHSHKQACRAPLACFQTQRAHAQGGLHSAQRMGMREHNCASFPPRGFTSASSCLGERNPFPTWQ